ncbi:MAG: YfcC family protein [Anaerolineales bacterium]|nr:YfcC family protein [Anaerolineales bacterium]
MQEKSGAQISTRAFLQSLAILFVLMMVAGVLTRTVPAGEYTRLEVDGRLVIDPASYHATEHPDYPIWRWFTAPIEVLGAEGNLILIVIIIFLLSVGGAFAVLDKSGIVKAAIGKIVQRFGGQKYLLMLIITFFFMSIGAFFGIFEEIVPLVPIMVALAYMLGWDALTGLGMSILATNMGFSAAITNPFTIVVAQELAGLETFSGWWLRLIIFAVIYIIFAIFLTAYARRIEKDPASSFIYNDDQAEREKYSRMDASMLIETNPAFNQAITWFVIFTFLILVVLVAGAFIEAISDVALPLVGVLFLIAGIGAGFISGAGGKTVLRGVWEGVTGILPGIPLILMAVSIKHIVVSGGILDTLLHAASQPFAAAHPIVAALIIYLLALGIEFFVASGSAKAFLMMPILLPLADLIGVTRQTTVLAYCFGDGFSNLAYPTNPVLLICLGLTVVSYPKWIRWTAKLWFWILLATFGFISLAVVINYGPF